MSEGRAVAMPADAGARVITDEQRLNEIIDGQAGQSRGGLAQWQEPVRDRGGRRPGARIEVVAPPVGCRETLAEPSLKPKRREFDGVNGGGERLLVRRRDAVFEQGQPRQTRLGEQIMLPAWPSPTLRGSHRFHMGLSLD